MGEWISRRFSGLRDAVHGLGPAEWLVPIALLLLLCAPRVTLLDAAGSSVRLDDLLILLLAVYALFTMRALVRSRGQLLWWLTAAAAATGATLSAVTAASRGDVTLGAALLYALRPFEYWVVFPAMLAWIAMVGRRSSWVVVTNVLALTTWLQLSVAVLQLMGVPVGFSKFTYERAAGLTAGPYELGAMAAMLFCFWLAHRRYLLAALALASVIVTQSRVSLLAVVVGACIVLVFSRTLQESVSRYIQWTIGRLRESVARRVVGLAIVVVVFALIVVVAAPVAQRFAGTSIVGSWNEAGERATAVDSPLTSEQYAQIAYDEIGNDVTNSTGSSDVSNVVRFYRWHILLDNLFISPARMILGLGPSYAGPSVDGALLRIVVEFGFLGLLLWAAWFACTFRMAPVWMLAVLGTIITGSLFIDVLFAMRPMLLFWGLAALALSTAGRAVTHNDTVRHRGET